MSYPRKIHPLVVEDEGDASINYRDIFSALAQDFDLVAPRFAQSVDDAKAALRTSTIFHLLVLDLGLPQHRRGQADPGVEPGLEILDLAINRHEYPIPAVVIISGRLNQTKLPGLWERLQKFWYGQPINKGVDEDVEIAKALRAINRYSDVGIHVQDGQNNLCPTLAPREEDMLRRCILKQEQCIGVDLEWWGSYTSHSSTHTAGGPSFTKVLAGRFILDNGMEFSHPTFFKFEAAENAPYVQRDVAIMHQKLNHVKVACAMTAPPRSLLVTQKVGDSQGRPVPLADFLRAAADAVLPRLQGVVADVAEQLRRLGEEREEQRVVREILWPHHQRERLEELWSQYACAPGGEAPESNPLTLLDELRRNETSVWVPIRACTHGDLNSTNVALDAENEQIRAYIFDAAGVKQDVSLRDFATLEVTSLLHHPRSVGAGMVRGCADLYDTFVMPPETFNSGTGSDLLRNTRELIASIRRHAAHSHEAEYALMVYDVAMLQLGGLAIEVSGNKISDPVEAALLAGLIAKWYRRITTLA